MILMDEPSMGLSPLLVKECSRSSGRSTATLASRFCWWSRTRALRVVASHGYIMEQGKVVLDGSADETARQ